MKFLFTVTLQSNDGRMIQKNVVAAQYTTAITLAQAAVDEPTSVVSFQKFGSVDITEQ